MTSTKCRRLNIPRFAKNQYVGGNIKSRICQYCKESLDDCNCDGFDTNPEDIIE